MCRRTRSAPRRHRRAAERCRRGKCRGDSSASSGRAATGRDRAGRRRARAVRAAVAARRARSRASCGSGRAGTARAACRGRSARVIAVKQPQSVRRREVTLGHAVHRCLRPQVAQVLRPQFALEDLTVWIARQVVDADGAAMRCCLPTRALVHSTSASSPRAHAALARTTTASGVSPQRSLGIPITATSRDAPDARA